MAPRTFSRRILSSLCALIILSSASLLAQMEVKKLTIPEPGIDNIKITMVETYTIQGVGTDTVKLEGTLVTRRGPALLGPGQSRHSWQDSAVVAEFTSLDMSGESKVFGPVHVTLDKSQPTFAMVRAGKCAAAVGVSIEMPKLQRTLKTRQPVQLTSVVTSIPPIGDEKTTSVGAVELVDQNGRSQGKLDKAQVLWRSLVSQKKFTEVSQTGGTVDSVATKN